MILPDVNVLIEAIQPDARNYPGVPVVGGISR
jgi:hypothetical protein